MLNLTFRTATPFRSLLMASGSVDDTGNYVFQVRTHEAAESLQKTISYWDTANGDDTMVTVWNPADEAQDFNFTISYSGGEYVLPLHLAARATRSFNLASFIKDQVLDANGHAIPLTITSGSAKLTGVHADNESILVDMDAGSFNAQKATCSFYCISCGGYINSYVTAPITIIIFSNFQLHAYVKDYSGASYQWSGSSWASSNTNIATMSSSTSGLAKGINKGAFTASATLSSVPVFNSNYCAYDASCNQYTTMTPSNGGQVTANPLTITSVSPIIYGGSGTISITGRGFTQLAGGSSVQVPGVSVPGLTIVSDSLMTSPYQSLCFAVVGPTTINVTPANTDIPPASGTVSINLPGAPLATIMLGGSIISGTQSVVVGQQISLSASVSLPSCMTLSSQQWSSPSGTAIGGYAPTTTSGSVQALPAATGPSYMFYWVAPGTSLTESYHYLMSGGGSTTTSPTATTTFNVQGPSSSNVQTSGAYYRISGAQMLWGLIFTGSGTQPAQNNGTFSWVQVITTNQANVTLKTGATGSCNLGTGLDDILPYASGLAAADGPTLSLPATDQQVSFSASAQMYFMWTPTGLTNAIMVPLGYLPWNWSGSATYSSSTGQWSSQSGGVSPSSFVGGSTYPTWTQKAQDADTVCE